jgi:hypothetical protein
MRHRGNIIPLPASSSDRRPMCAPIVTATIVVMTSSPSCDSHRGPTPERILMLSDLMLGVGGRLFKVAVAMARHAPHIVQNSTPSL